MQNETSLQQLKLSQMMLMTSFCHIKTEIIGLILRDHNPAIVQPLESAIDAFEEVLATAYDYMGLDSHHESLSELKLFARGLQVFQAQIDERLVAAFTSINTLYNWMDTQNLERWEQDNMYQTLSSLENVFSACQGIIGHSEPAVANTNPFI